MKSHVTLMLAGLIAATTAYADDDTANTLKLAQQKNCLTCHAIDHKVIGPAYKDVAAKYKDDKGAPARLAAKVKAGGGGVWGAMAMPPNAVSDAEADTLVKWVLSQNK